MNADEYYEYREASCSLPNYCDCKQCQYWGENGWDVSLTPDWQLPKEGEEE